MTPKFLRRYSLRPLTGRLLDRLARMRNAISLKEGMSVTAVLMWLIGIEWLVRQFPQEPVDLAGVMMLILLISGVAMVHRQFHLEWVAALVRLARTGVARWKESRLQFGPDLKRTPPLTSGLPVPMVLRTCLLTMICAVVVFRNAVASSPLRETMTQISGVLWIVGLATLWIGLATTILFSSLIGSLAQNDLLPGLTDWPVARRRRFQRRISLVILPATVISAFLLPVTAAVLTVTFSLPALVIWMHVGHHPPLNIVWTDLRRRLIRTIEIRAALFLQLATLWSISLLLILLTLGPVALGRSPEFLSRPLTLSLGYFTAWTLAFRSVQCVVCGGLQMHLLRRNDPERPAPLTIRTARPQLVETQAHLQELCDRKGWTLRSPAQKPQPCDVVVELISANVPRDQRRAEDGIVRVSPQMLDDDTTLTRIVRRDIVQRRRRLLSGLQKGFKALAAIPNPPGEGCWIAPHLWFISGIKRDSRNATAELSTVVGPWFIRCMPLPARQYFFDVCRMNDIHLIYLEDGIDFRAFRRVLRVLFERAELEVHPTPLSEIHFQGLPKVRVLVHDYSIGQDDAASRFGRSRYPEPEYAEIGRARILHVFRDRGDAFEPIEVPDSSDSLLSPSGAA